MTAASDPTPPMGRGRLRAALIAVGVVAVGLAATAVLAAENNLTGSDERWAGSAVFLAIAIAFVAARRLRTGRWSPTDAEARANARALGSWRSAAWTLALGVVAAVVAVAVTGEWLIALFLIALAVVHAAIDRVGWTWFANR